MLWHLLCGGGYGYTTGISRSPDEPPKPLDKITCGGQANVKALFSSAKVRGLVCFVALIGIILHPGDIHLLLAEKISSRKVVFSSRRYQHHFVDLRTAGIIMPCALESLKFFNRYFSVPKSPVLDRAIFDGKVLSTKFSVPPPVNLADITMVIKKLEETVSVDNRGVSLLAGDLRHWFHQIEVNGELSHYFGVAIEENGRTQGYRWYPSNGLVFLASHRSGSSVDVYFTL